MTRLTGPLFSLDARKTFGGAVVYSAWKGLNYARIRVIPYNPKSAYQVGTRTAMTKAVWYWRTGSYITAPEKAAWEMYATGTNMSGFNRFVKAFVKANLTAKLYVFSKVPTPA
jgi:hypothetical protein